MKILGKRSVASVLKVLLDVAFYGVAVILAITVFLTVVSPFIDISGGDGTRLGIEVSFSVDAQTLARSAPSADIANARIERARGDLTFPVEQGAKILGPLLMVVVMLAVGLCVLGLLRAVFRTLREGQPFVAANARRIRWIAWAVVFGEVARSGLVYSTNRFATTHFTANGLTFDTRPDFNLFTIVSGLVILVISEVFRAGTRLDEDQSLTV